MNRYLSSLAVATVVSVVAVTAYRAGIESVEPEPCNILDPEFGLVMGCYEKDKIAETSKGDIYFWRLNDRTRTAFGGWESPPAAALILDSGKDAVEKEDILKAYCPNGCWVAGNGDPLPEILKIDENRYAVWSPNDRRSNRHGADGYIEMLDLRYLSLTALGKEITIYHPQAMSLRDYKGCKYVVTQALESFDPGYPVAGGYITVPYPHFQPLEERCPVYTYNGDVDPETVIPDLKNKLENAEIL